MKVGTGFEIGTAPGMRDLESALKFGTVGTGPEVRNRRVRLRPELDQKFGTGYA